MLSIKDENELIYYINLSLDRNLSKRELRGKIKNNEYKRLSLGAINKISNSKLLDVKDLVLNPILIKNKNNNM